MNRFIKHMIREGVTSLCFKQTRGGVLVLRIKKFTFSQSVTNSACVGS